MMLGTISSAFLALGIASTYVAISDLQAVADERVAAPTVIVQAIEAAPHVGLLDRQQRVPAG
jgi:hypothetical protein